MLTERTRQALAAMLYDVGFTAVARLIAEGTTDVYEEPVEKMRWAAGLTPRPAPESGGARLLADVQATLAEACDAVDRTGCAQLVLITPNDTGEWLKPELLPVIEGALRVPKDAPMRETPDPFAVREPGDYPPIA